VIQENKARDHDFLDSDTSSIVLLFLHPHRVNDLKNWLKSVALAEELNILVLVSNRTVDQMDALLNTSHQITWFNIETEEPDYAQSKTKFPIILLCQEFKRSYSFFKNRYRVAHKLIADHKDAVLVTYDDRMPSVLPILKACYNLTVPVFLPAILTTQPESNAPTANTLKSKRKIESCITWFAKKIFPHHVNQDGRLFYNPMAYFVLLLFNSVPPRPWVKGTIRYITKLGVESKLAHKKLVAAGADPEKLIITGMPVYDLMDFSREDKLEKNTLLCALPQYGEHGAMKVDDALLIVEEILKAFTAFSGDVVISLHPRMDPEIYQPLIEKQGFYCVVGNIDVWLKKATLFFAASSSTTIYSSLIMGIPTVALNHVFPGSNVFRDFKSITYIQNSPKEIVAVIDQPKAGIDKLIKNDQQLLSSSLVTDGKCGARNLNVIQCLLKGSF